MEYSAEEYTDMIILYGEAGRSAYAASLLYAERFPDRERHPSRNVILRCVQRARQTGRVLPTRHTAGRQMRICVHDEERILRHFEENPGDSVRRAARALGLSKNAVHRSLRYNGLRPFHFQKVQQFLPGDKEHRVNFCGGFLAQCRRNALFPDLILWTDEATFTPNGVFNSRNFLLWDEENPHAVRQGAFQYRYAINVWAEIIADQVIGPYFLPARLNGETYAQFLENQLPVLLENVPLRVRQQLIFQHDGAPAHFSRRARRVLNARYTDRWMGRGGPIIWPPRSPDLNVLDYFVWGYIKQLVEPRRDDEEDAVREAILAAFNSITSEMAHRSTRDIVRRANACLQQHGSHFEQLLK